MTTLTGTTQAFVLGCAAFDLRTLGRLGEAVAPMQEALERFAAREDWKNAEISASNLSELHLTLGDVAEAVTMAESAVEYADRSRVDRARADSRTYWANALHQGGEAARAQALFEEAETLQARIDFARPRLYSMRGYRYCDLLLALGHAAEVRERATYALKIARGGGLSLLAIALDHLSLGRAQLALGEHDEARVQHERAVEGVRQAGVIDYLSRGLLARAALFRETGNFERARQDLKETMRIAKRSEMRLSQCDAHLEYTHLTLAEGDRDKAREHVAEAKRLVDKTGYGRRRKEVEELIAATAEA